jgi:hypothetical protein
VVRKCQGLKQVVDGATAFGVGKVDFAAVETALTYRPSSFRALPMSQNLVERRRLVAARRLGMEHRPALPRSGFTARRSIGA